MLQACRLSSVAFVRIYFDKEALVGLGDEQPLGVGAVTGAAAGGVQTFVVGRVVLVVLVVLHIFDL